MFSYCWYHISLMLIVTPLMTGTAEKRKYVPIDAVYHKLPSGSISEFLPFHSLIIIIIIIIPMIYSAQFM